MSLFAKPDRSPVTASARPGDLEVLPPDHAHQHPGRDKALAWLVQYVLDNLIRVPGTRARIGLMPFLEILPIFGDGAAVAASALTIIEGARRRVPKVVLVRMALNVLVNGMVGILPVVGEVFSFWFKPSYRNYLLLQKHSVIGETAAAAGTAHRATRSDWGFVLFVLIVLFLLVSACVAAGAYLVYQLVYHVRWI